MGALKLLACQFFATSVNVNNSKKGHHRAKIYESTPARKQ